MELNMQKSMTFHTNFTVLKIYVKEINKLNKHNLINGCANITGGGLINNLIRIIPKNHCINLHLDKIKTTNVFRWLKKK